MKDNLSRFYHDYSEVSSWVHTAYSEHAVMHVAVAIVYSIQQDVHCGRCTALLNGEMKTKSLLSVSKNRGGLKFATDDVITICKTAEKVFRRYEHCLMKTDNISHTLITETLTLLLPTFHDDKHFFEQEFLVDHRYKLLHLVITNYLDKQLHHENNLQNDPKDRVRMLYNKLTIAKEQ
ncbi:hypothetical protein QAD02_007256 [Eretmocerus hayati]|uniref:Uncharacterized protein n=1 Tax=Eretmocerus hayati TaxID=131215 RepID=A0ACC2N3G3_9HYME|nr:hypothetical protein QAD02_007256 [Eretmocerus hayati]